MVGGWYGDGAIVRVVWVAFSGWVVGGISRNSVGGGHGAPTYSRLKSRSPIRAGKWSVSRASPTETFSKKVPRSLEAMESMMSCFSVPRVRLESESELELELESGIELGLELEEEVRVIESTYAACTH